MEEGATLLIRTGTVLTSLAWVMRRGTLPVASNRRANPDPKSVSTSPATVTPAVVEQLRAAGILTRSDIDPVAKRLLELAKDAVRA